MSKYSISNNRQWYDIVQDGNGGESNRILGTVLPFVSVNTSIDGNSRKVLSIFYYDSVSGYIRRSFDRSPDMEFQNLDYISGLTNLVGYTEPSNYSNNHYYYTDSNNLYSRLNNLPLTTFSTNITNVKLKKYISSTNAYFVISVGSNLYSISGDSTITYTQLTDDYDGRDFYPYIDDKTQITYVAYTNSTGIQVLTPNTGTGGVITHGTITYTSARLGNSAVFTNTIGSGATNYITIGCQQTNPISISLWFNTTDPLTTNLQTVFALTDSSLNPILTVNFHNPNASNSLVLNITGSSGYVNIISYGTQVVANTWYHLCITIDSSFNTILYINGFQVGAVVSSSINNVSTIFIGGDGIGVECFIGYIDELNVFNTAISSSDVTTLYGLGSVTSGLIAHYAFDAPISNLYNPTVTTITGSSNIVTHEYVNAFVAGGSGTNKLAYSSDGIKWTGSSSGNSIFSGGTCTSVAYNGTMWVAGGNGTNKLAYSYDGVNWTGSTSGNPLFGMVQTVAWNGNGMWMAGGNDNCMASSTDGINWTAVTGIFNTILAIAGNSTIWVAAGYNGTQLAYSTDGTTWTASTSGCSILSNGCSALAYNGTMWVAGGSISDVIAYSSDGMNWTASASAKSLFGTQCIGVAWNGSMWVAGGNSYGSSPQNSLIYSTDGINWTASANGNDIFSQGGKIAWNGSVWIANGNGNGNGNMIAYSSDGINWTASTSATSIFSGGGCSGLGSGTVTIYGIPVTASIKNNSGVFNNNLGATANNFITVSNKINFPISTAFWFYPLQTANVQTILSLGNKTNTNNSLEINLQSGYLSMNVEGNIVTSNVAIVPNNWYSVFTNIGNSNIDLYVNGQSNTISITSNVLTYTDQFVIGCNNNGLTNGFSGYLDELYVFNNFNPINPAIFNSNITIADNTGQSLYIPFDTPVAITNANPVNYNIVGNVSVTSSIVGLGGAAFFVNTPGEGHAQTNYITVPNSQNVPISISFWFNTNDETNYQNPVSLTNTTLDGVGLQFTCGGSPNQLIIGAAIPTAWTDIGNYPLTPNTWYHVVFTMDASFNYNLYVNNTLNASGTGTAAITDYTTFILGGSTQFARGYNGYLDEFIVYNRIISATEVSSLYNIRGIVGTSSNSLKTVSNGAIIYMPLDGNTKTSEFSVACGFDAITSMKYSYDGIIWHNGNNIFNNNLSYGVAYGNDIWVAVGQGSDNTIGYSIDGIKWVGCGTIFNIAGLSIAWNNGMWVAGGMSNAGGPNLAYSYNGINWISIKSELFVNAQIKTISSNGLVWLAGGTSGGNNALMIISTDGINWNPVNVSSIFTSSVNIICSNGYIFVAGGSGTSGLAYSTDGINWNPSVNNLINGIASIAWNGSIWVASGNGTGTYFIYSSDGMNWNSGVSVFCCAQSISWNGNMFVGLTNIGYVGSIYSIDGITWYKGNQETQVFSSNGVYIASSIVLPITNPRLPNILNITNGRMFGSVSYSGVTGGSTLFVNPITQGVQPTNYITISNKQNVPITVSIWFNSNDGTNYQTIFSFTEPTFTVSNVSLIIDYIPSSKQIGIFGALPSQWNVNINSGSNSILPNTWNHVAIIIDSSFIVNGYLNGIKFGSAIGSGALNNNSLIMLGGFAGLRGFNGYLNEFMVYNYVLSDLQIFDLFKLKSIEGGRIIYLPLNEPLSNTPIVPVTTGTTVGTITYTTAIDRNSGYFNNVVTSPATNYIKIENTKDIPMSFSLWFNTKNITDSQCLFSILNSSLNGIGLTTNLFIATGTTSLSIGTNGSTINLNPTILINTWYHLCITINGSGNMIVYLNNNNIGSQTEAAIGINNNYIVIANNSFLSFNGYIDDFAVYNRELTTIEVKNLFNLQNVTNGQIVFLPFDNQIVAPVNPTVVGTVNYTTSVKGNSAFFNNATLQSGGNAVNYLIIPFNQSWPFTISFWFNVTDVTQSQTPVSLTDNNGHQVMSFYVDSQSINFIVSSTNIGNQSINSKQWNHICLTTDKDLNINFYVNGNLVITSGSEFYPPTKVILGSDYNYTNAYNGYIDELIIYNRVLSTDEIIALANAKNIINDNLTIYAPLDKSHYVWTPKEINGCQLWLDGADPLATGVAPANGTAVSTWSDKSGNGNNGIASGTGNYLNGTILFDGTTTWYNTNYTSQSIQETGFIVVKYTNTGLWAGDLISSSAGGGRETYIYSNNFNLHAVGGSTNQLTGITTLTPGTTYLFAYSYTPSTENFFTNGSADNSTTGSFSYSGNGTTTIGAYATGSGLFTGAISEVVIFNKTLTTGQRQQVEGYLSKKWGLQSSLPINHPYYKLNTQISGPAWKPNNLSSLAFWLDGVDPLGDGTVLQNGNIVSTWVDKSGNGYNATGINNPRINGNNQIDFDENSQQYYTTSYPSNQSTETIFVVYKMNTIGQYSLVDTSSQGGRAFQSYNTSGPSLANSANAWDIFGLVSPSINTLYIANCSYNSAGINMFINGNPSGNNTTNPAFTAGTTNIGAGYYSPTATGWYLNGSIGEILIFNTVLNSVDRQTVEGYLAWKWGLTRQLPISNPFKFTSPIYIPTTTISNIFVAGGSNTEGPYQTMAYSNDGITWNASVTGTALFYTVNFIVYGNGLWLAGGNCLAYSTDGNNWYLSSIISGNIIGIIWASNLGQWIVSVNGDLYYSINGLNWSILYDTTYIGYLAYYNNTIYGIDNNNSTLFFSSDGTQWSATGLSNVSSIGYNGTQWLVGCNQNATYPIYYSSNGISWTGSTSSQSLFQGMYVSQYGPNINIYQFAWNGTNWVAATQSTTVVGYSSDGINWTGAGCEQYNNNFTGVAWNGTYFIAVSSKAALGGSTNPTNVLYSTNGINWTVSTSGSAVLYDRVACVAVGNNISIYNPNIPQQIPNLFNWLDTSDITTLFTDTAATIPVQNLGDHVNCIVDKVGIANVTNSSSFGWVGSNVSTTSNSVTNTSSSGVWDAYAYSNITTTNMGTVSFKANSTDGDFIVGFATGTSNSPVYNNFTYGLRCQPNATLQYIVNGAFIDFNPIPSYTTSNEFKIVYNGTNGTVNYYQDNSLILTLSASANNTFYLYIGLGLQNSQAKNILFIGNSPTYNPQLLNLNPGIDFSNSTQLMSTSVLKSSNVTVFWVGIVSSNIPQYGSLWGHFTDVNNDIQLRKNPAGQMTWYTNGDNNNLVLNLSLNQPVIYWATMEKGINMNFTMITNNGIYTNISNIESFSWTAGSAPIYVAKDNSGNPSNSFMSEILYYQRVLTQNEINTIVGYLGQKWGIKTVVPSAPIENAVSKWLPNKDSKLAVWLDMADYSSMTVNKTTSVSSIVDKVSGISFTPAGSVPTNLTLSSTLYGSFGNISSLNFDNNSGDNAYMTGSYSFNNSGSMLFVANINNITDTNQAIINWAGDLAVGFLNNNTTLSLYNSTTGNSKELANTSITIGLPTIVYCDWNGPNVSLSTNGSDLITGTSTIFNPTSISGIALWLDGADQTSVTLSGLSVTQWNDKSGNGYNAIGNGGLSYSNNNIIYDGSTGYFSTPYQSGSAVETGFAVVNMTNLNSMILGGTNAGVRCFIYDQSQGFAIGYFGQNPLYTNISLNTSTTYLISYNYSSTSASININGTQVAINSGNYSAYNNTNTLIGGWSNGPGNLQAAIQGAVSEIIVFNTTLDNSDTQKVEGYLAWKWGLQASLPTNHPYYSGPPSGGAYYSQSILTIGRDLHNPTMNLGEVLVYSEVISTDARQKAEGYLANKWGLIGPNSSLDSSSNPYFNSAPTITNIEYPLTNAPKLFNGLLVWLDGADPYGTGISNGTAPSIGTLVNKWYDKSGNNNNYIQTELDQVPTYGYDKYYNKNGIIFNGSQSYIQEGISFLDGLNKYTIICAYRFDDTTGNPSELYRNYSGNNIIWYRLWDGAINVVMGGLIGGNNMSYGSTISNGSGISTIISDSTAATYLNGTKILTQYKGLTAESGNTLISIGSLNGVENMTGSIFEFMIFNYAMNDNERQVIESYLGNKWGLGQKLPIDHQYYMIDNPNISLTGNIIYSGSVVGGGNSTIINNSMGINSSNVILIPNEQNIPLSINFWMNTNDIISYQTVVGLSDASFNTSGLNIDIVDGQLVANICLANISYPNISASILPNQWFNVGLNIDNDYNGTLYLNGLNIGTANGGSGIANIANYTQFILGGPSDNSSRSYNGYIQNFNVYNRTLLDYEMKNLYNSIPVGDGLIINQSLDVPSNISNVITVGTIVNSGVSDCSSNLIWNSGSPTNYITIPNVQNIPITVSLWFNMIYNGLQPCLLTFTDQTLYNPSGEHTGITVLLNQNYVNSINISGQISFDSPANSVMYNTWNHFAFTINESYVTTGYLNGIKFGAATGTSLLNYYTTILLGGNFQNRGFNGYIENFLVYNRVLSGGEVYSLYNKVQISNGLTINLPLTNDLSLITNNDSTATVIGSIQYVSGVIGNCVYFTNNVGINATQYITVPNSQNLPITYSFWMNCTNTNASGVQDPFSIGGIGLNGYGSIRCDISGNLLTVYICTEDSTNISYNISSNVWYHICVTIDSTYKGTLYVNGNIIGSNQSSRNSILNGTQINIGGGPDLTDTPFSYNGYVDDVRIYNRTLTPPEILSLYNLKNVTLGLITYLTFDTPSTIITETGLVPINSPFPQQYKGNWYIYAYYALNDVVLYNGYYWILISLGSWTVGGVPPGYGWSILTNISGSTIFNNVANATPANTIVTTYNTAGPITIAFWMYCFDVTQAQTSISLTDNSNTFIVNFDIGIPSGTVGFHSAVQGGVNNDNKTISSNTWYHICGTIDSSSQYNQVFYVNGVQYATATGTPLSAYTKFRIGGNSENDRGFAGYLQNFVVYNRAISNDEVAGLYNFNVPTLGLMINLPLNQSSYETLNTMAETINGNPSYTNGQIGNAVNFTDGTSYITVPNTINVPMTISFWFKDTGYASAGQNGNCILSGDTFNNGFLVFLDGITFSMWLAMTNTWTVTINAAYNSGSWNHAGISIDSLYNVTLYINGVISGTGIGAGNISNLTKFSFGSANTYSSYGSIDDFQVYNRALHPFEINNIYQTGYIGGKSLTLNGLVTYLPFENGPRNQETVGNVTYSGVNGGSAFFNNSDGQIATNYITIPNTINVPISFSFWFNVKSFNNGAALLSANNDNPWSILIRCNTNSINISCALPYVWTIDLTTSTINTNIWYHLCITIDQSFNILVYLNNTNIHSGTGSGNFINLTTLYLGGNPNVGSPYNYGFNGYLEDFMLYNRALSSGEVTTLYNVGTITSGRIIYLHLDSGNFNINGNFNSNNNLSLTNNPYNMNIVATLSSTQHSIPRIIMYNESLYLFVVNSIDNYIYSTIIDQNQVATTLNKFKEAKDFKISIISNKIILTAVNPNGILNRMTVANNSLKYFDFINTNVKIQTNAFDITNMNDEEFIFYIGTDNLMHQVWNPSLFVDIYSPTFINDLQIRNNDENQLMYPSFSASVFDYCIQSNTENSLRNIRIGIGCIDGTFNTFYYPIYPGQCLHIYDYVNHYYVKLLPNNIVLGTNITKNTGAGYIPGYYVGADTFGQGSQYYTVHSSNGVPVWYRRTTSDPNFAGNPQLCSLFLGMGKNRLITCIFDGNRTRTVVDVDSLIEENYKAISPDSRGSGVGWDVHEVVEIKSPLNRRSNIIFFFYTDGGFYIQEQNKNHELVWEFWSSDLINYQGGDYFHFNALDVHPITGDLVCSFRNCSTVACINYVTKNIDWAIDPTGGFAASLKNSSLVKFLTPTNEPYAFGYQYNGTSAQHDARWHYEITPLVLGRNIISIFDDGSFTGSVARGVIYEIDLANNQAIHRGSAFSPYYSSSGYMGSYKIQREINGTFSHLVDYVQQHNCFWEFADDGTGIPSSTQLFTMDMPGDHYRLSKARPVDLDIIAMRKTAGMPISTLLDTSQLWNSGSATNVTVNSLTSVTKTSSSFGYNSQIYSNTSYVKPTFSIQLTSLTGSQIGVVGLSENPAADISYTNINYGWEFDLTSQEVAIYELGSLISNSVSPITNVNSVYEINFDGINVNYLIDGVNVRSVKRTNPNALYCNLCILGENKTLSNIYFNQYLG